MTEIKMDTIRKTIFDSGVVPVLAIENADDAMPTAEAILAGGIKTVEITFRTEAAAESIKRVTAGCPEMCVGAGTVFTLDQCKEALDLGARYIVSAGLSEKVVRYCVENSVPVFPGCVTPTEIMTAMELGLDIVKFFPASVYGGLKAIKALSAPFQTIRFMPTGGVNAENLREYLSTECIFAVGGSWLATKKDISDKCFGKIRETCQEATNIVKLCRK